MKNETKTEIALIIFVIGVVALAYFISLQDEEPTKPDGFLWLEIEGYRLEKHLGHQEVMDFCRKEHEELECKDAFYGCGAVNCVCKPKKGE